MTIGQRIRELREEKGLSLGELAAQIGIATSTLQRYESGRIQSIPPDRMDKIASVLDTSVSWLFGELDKTPKSAVDIKVSQTQKAYLDMIRSFDSHERDSIYSIVKTISDLHWEVMTLQTRLDFAEEFIGTTEYASDYEKERDAEFEDNGKDDEQ